MPLVPDSRGQPPEAGVTVRIRNGKHTFPLRSRVAQNAIAAYLQQHGWSGSTKFINGPDLKSRIPIDLPVFPMKRLRNGINLAVQLPGSTGFIAILPLAAEQVDSLWKRMEHEKRQAMRSAEERGAELAISTNLEGMPGDELLTEGAESIDAEAWLVSADHLEQAILALASSATVRFIDRSDAEREIFLVLERSGHATALTGAQVLEVLEAEEYVRSMRIDGVDGLALTQLCDGFESVRNVDLRRSERIAMTYLTLLTACESQERAQLELLRIQDELRAAEQQAAEVQARIEKLRRSQSATQELLDAPEAVERRRRLLFLNGLFRIDQSRANP